MQWVRYIQRYSQLERLAEGVSNPNLTPTLRERRIVDLTQAIAEYSKMLIVQVARFRNHLDRFCILYVYERNLNLSNQLREIGRQLQDAILMPNWLGIYNGFVDVIVGPLIDTLQVPEEIVISSDSEPDDPNDPDFVP